MPVRVLCRTCDVWIAVAESSDSKINDLEDTVARQNSQILQLFSTCLKLKGLIERNLPAVLKAESTETVHDHPHVAHVASWCSDGEHERPDSGLPENFSSCSSEYAASSSSEPSLEHTILAGNGRVSDRAVEEVVRKVRGLVSQVAQAQMRQKKVQGDQVYRELWCY